MAAISRILTGPLVTIATVAAILLLNKHVVTIPNPAVLYFCAIVFATYIGGWISGAISAAITLAYAAAFFSSPDQLFHYTPDNMARVIVLFVATPCIVLLTGLLQARAERAVERERAIRGSIEQRNQDLGMFKAALDRIDHGIVLLGPDLRADFINRAFQSIWALPDDKAQSKPPFVSLLHHGRDSGAYELPPGINDAYVAERVAEVRSRDEITRDIRLTNGRVYRLMSKSLGEDRKMLTYTEVSDIVRPADELERLRAALEHVEYGIMLLDADLRVQFVNAALRRITQLPGDFVDCKPNFTDLFRYAHGSGIWNVPLERFEAYAAERVAWVMQGDPMPRDLQLSDGRILRAQCVVLPDGGRMLSYIDVTEIVRTADELTQLAANDSMTGIPNRRHFLNLADAEWSRSRRHGRPLCLLMIDIDHFKSINDRFGHSAGDRAIVHVASLCNEGNRASDVMARLGGEEFAVLLPETDLNQAVAVAERLRRKLAETPLNVDGQSIALTVSIGAAIGTPLMADFHALMKAADRALYEAKHSGRNRVACGNGEQSAGRDAAA